MKLYSITNNKTREYNMYNILIVDDEPWILKGIEASCNWEEFNCQIVCATTEPHEALNYIISEKPDIVFTDIQMSEMTGIELMKQVREKGINSEFIVISGYSEFNYAKDAIKYGAFHYLLKPIDKPELNAIMKKIIYTLDDKNCNYKKTVASVELFDDLIYNSGLYTIDALIGKSKDEKKYSNYQIAVSDSSEISFTSGVRFSRFNLGANKHVYFLNTDSDAFAHILNIQSAKIGISSLSDSDDVMTMLFRQANIAYSGFFVNPEKNVNRFSKCKASICGEFVQKIINSGNKKAVISTLPAFAVESQLDIEDIAFIFNELILYLNYFFISGTISNPIPLMGYDEIMENFSNLQEITDYILGLIDSVNILPSKNIDEGFQKILRYIDTNYNKNITLKTLSVEFSYAPAYLCQLFKRNINMTFTEYIVKVRIDNACRLLTDTNKKIMVIADETGYNDYCYFSKLFKKNKGVTPLEYRRNGKL